eukprot:scaffold1442_cov128-Cylindrotheca_fusiformis.AAC.38
MLLMLQKPETCLGFVASTEFAPGAGNQLEEEQRHFDGDTMVQQINLALALAASPESAIGVHHCAELLNDAMKHSLKEQQAEPLPRTLSEALKDPRPVVVTSTKAPFTIVAVNGAWEGLCGFTSEEAKHKHLGELLTGPETEVDVAREMVTKLQREHYSQATLTNYTKEGRKFKNHVQLGSLVKDNGEYSDYFVGVLHEIPETRQTI